MEKEIVIQFVRFCCIPSNCICNLLVRRKQKYQNAKPLHSCCQLCILWVVGLEISLSNLLQYDCRLLYWHGIGLQFKWNTQKTSTIGKYFY